MQKSTIYYSAAVFLLIAFALGFLFSAKNVNDSSINSNPLGAKVIQENDLNNPSDSSSLDNSDESSDVTSDTNDQDTSEGGGGGSSSNDDPPLVGLNEFPDSMKDCGVSNQIDFQSNIDVKSGLNEAQRVILDCMADTLLNCQESRTRLISNSGNPDIIYEVKGESNGNCILEGTNLYYSLKSCSFSDNSVNYIFNQADSDYPNISGARFFKIMEIVNAGGANLDLGNGNVENVICL